MFIVKKIVVTLCLLSALAVVAVGQTPPPQMNASVAGETQEKKSLYQRLGGYDPIAAEVDNFITRLSTGPPLDSLFSRCSIPAHNRLRHYTLIPLAPASPQ